MHTTPDTIGILGTFIMFFHMVLFILSRVLGQETTFSLVEILQQPIKNFHFKVFKAYTSNKMDYNIWKTTFEKYARLRCQILCALLFKAGFFFNIGRRKN